MYESMNEWMDECVHVCMNMCIDLRECVELCQYVREMQEKSFNCVNTKVQKYE